MITLNNTQPPEHGPRLYYCQQCGIAQLFGPLDLPTGCARRAGDLHLLADDALQAAGLLVVHRALFSRRPDGSSHTWTHRRTVALDAGRDNAEPLEVAR